MYINQRTIKKENNFKGLGVHSGKLTSIRLLPAPANTGVVFRRVDLEIPHEIKVSALSVSDTQMCTCIQLSKNVKVTTIEHFMCALSILGIDNIVVEIDNEEFPIMDGSSAPFVFLLNEHGILNYLVSKKFIKIEKRIEVSSEDKRILLTPNKTLDFNIDYEIDFENNFINNTNQKLSLSFSKNNIQQEVSRARTFGFTKDIEYLRALNLAKGGSINNAIVIDGSRMINKEPLRYDDEFVRHKILDAIGDLYMQGLQIVGNLYAYKSGHHLNNLLMRELLSDESNYSILEFPVKEKELKQINTNEYEPILSFAG
jgi:UDP-3-O-[3-hydroxymyristoyl] N-acetylglucosamine deacetylase